MDRILRINSKKIVKRLANSSLKTERRRNIMVIISIILATFLISMCGVGIFASSQRQNLFFGIWRNTIVSVGVIIGKLFSRITGKN